MLAYAIAFFVVNVLVAVSLVGVGRWLMTDPDVRAMLGWSAKESAPVRAEGANFSSPACC